MHVPLVDLRAQLASIAPEIAGCWEGTLERGDFILGGAVAAFEREFAAYCGVGHAVGVDSGTSALELALRAVGVGPGDEVITAANTFIATAFAISHCGATPVLVDVEPDTLNMDPALVEAAVTPRTRAILPVHLYGQPADMDALAAVAGAHGLAIVEDACQAHGARHRGRRTGGLGHAAAFSFYPGKNLGAYGDAGAVVTDDAEVAAALRKLRNYGQERKHHHEHVGFNRRLDTLQAAVLSVKLRHLDAWNAGRRRVAARYGEVLGDAAVGLPSARDGLEHVWHLYVIRLDDRDGLASALAEDGIATGIHYPVPIHLQPAYAELGAGPGSFPVTEAAAGRILSLPVYAELTDATVEEIGARVAAFAGRREVRPEPAAP
ncbi:MAG: DegT/DnrJ/EryC1/StrS family aminotransferase [Thermoleophilia bacterium]|nr:DegT/DnrJ/EryC1/StrS family aminotransferase [Thermoleophilia bacterium]